MFGAAHICSAAIWVNQRKAFSVFPGAFGKRMKTLKTLITPVTGILRARRSTLTGMHSGKWLQEHEALAAIIFVTLSIGLTGFFAWVERRLFQKKHR